MKRLFLSTLILMTYAASGVEKEAASSPNVKKVFDAFASGRSEFYSSGTKADICQPFSGLDKTFCMDGYFFASHESALSRPLAKLKETLPDYISKSTPKDLLARQSFFRSLGMGVTQFGIDPTQLTQGLASLTESDQKFFMDGWGAGQYHRYGYLQSRQNCGLAPENLKSSCYWGMGRAFLLTGIPAGDSLVFDDNFVAGYLFTKAILKADVLSIKDIQHISMHATQMGEFFKFFVAKGAELKKELPKVATCLSQQHFSTCLGN